MRPRCARGVGGFPRGELEDRSAGGHLEGGKMIEYMWQATKGTACAAFVVRDNYVAKTAPILSAVRGAPLGAALALLARRGWNVEQIQPDLGDTNA